jgi:hypothetical protein
MGCSGQCSMVCSIGRKLALAGLGAGAKVGTNVHSHQAASVDIQTALPQVNGTVGDAGLRLATGWG